MASLAKQLRNPFIQQYLIEIVFPLIGYFFFDWDILIIGVYYLVDHLSAQILFFRRAYIIQTKGTVHNSGAILIILFALAFLVVFSIETVFLGYFVMASQQLTQVEIWSAFLDFAKSELWLLFPLVLLVYHMRDQFTFYMPRRYLNYNPKKLVIYDLIGNIVVITVFLLSGMLWLATGVIGEVSNILMIICFLILKISYDLTLKKYFLKQSLIKS